MPLNILSLNILRPGPIYPGLFLNRTFAIGNFSRYPWEPQSWMSGKVDIQRKEENGPIFTKHPICFRCLTYPHDTLIQHMRTSEAQRNDLPYPRSHSQQVASQHLFFMFLVLVFFPLCVLSSIVLALNCYAILPLRSYFYAEYICIECTQHCARHRSC